MPIPKPLILNELLPRSQDKYHLAVGKDLYILFDPDKRELLKPHQDIIRDKAVQFMIKACKQFGPGTYTLCVIGSASATGDYDYNMDLSGARAYNAGNYAIRCFEEKKKFDPALSKTEMSLKTVVIGKQLSQVDPLISHAKTKKRVEALQPMYRAALFRFSAGFVHPAEASIFFLREHYFFQFEKVTKPLPDFLGDVEKFVNNNPIIKPFAGWLWDTVLKPIKTALGPAASAANHMISFLIPKEVDYCYEIKDYRNKHALYDYAAMEHADSIDMMELLGILAGIYSWLKTILDPLSKERDPLPFLQAALKQFDDLADRIVEKVRSTFGDEAANAVANFLQLAREGNLQTQFFAPSSAWQPFRFYDGGPVHDVAQLQGAAERYGMEAMYRSVITLHFAGPVPNNWKDFNANATFSSFSGRNSLLGRHAMSKGTFTLIRGPYFVDLASGPFTPVKP